MCLFYDRSLVKSILNITGTDHNYTCWIIGLTINKSLKSSQTYGSTYTLPTAYTSIDTYASFYLIDMSHTATGVLHKVSNSVISVGAKYTSGSYTVFYDNILCFGY